MTSSEPVLQKVAGTLVVSEFVDAVILAPVTVHEKSE
jgi:hypothetical protein